MSSEMMEKKQQKPILWDCRGPKDRCFRVVLKKVRLGLVFDLVNQSLPCLTRRLRRQIDQEIWDLMTRSAACRTEKRRLARHVLECVLQMQVFTNTVSEKRPSFLLAEMVE
jgi:hypothetical protein